MTPIEKELLHAHHQLLLGLFDKLRRIDKQIEELANRNPPDELLTVSEVARLLNLTESTIYTRVSERTIPFQKNGKRLYFSRNEVLKMIHDKRD